MRLLGGLTLLRAELARTQDGANVANSFEVPAWYRWDLGSSFKTKALGHPLVLRANVLNVANRNHWEGVNNVTGLRLAAPRTATLSASVDF